MRNNDEYIANAIVGRIQFSFYQMNLYKVGSLINKIDKIIHNMLYGLGGIGVPEYQALPYLRRMLNITFCIDKDYIGYILAELLRPFRRIGGKIVAPVDCMDPDTVQFILNSSGYLTNEEGSIKKLELNYSEESRFKERFKEHGFSLRDFLNLKEGNKQKYDDAKNLNDGTFGYWKLAESSGSPSVTLSPQERKAVNEISRKDYPENDYFDNYKDIEKAIESLQNIIEEKYKKQLLEAINMGNLSCAEYIYETVYSKYGLYPDWSIEYNI